MFATVASGGWGAPPPKPLCCAPVECACTIWCTMASGKRHNTRSATWS